MKVRYSPDFFKQYKKANVRIRSSVDEKIKIFLEDPDDPQLDNHKLKDEYLGYSSIDITADYRAIYRETWIDDDVVAYFEALVRMKSYIGNKLQWPHCSLKNIPT